MDALVDPFSAPFMQRAWLELALLAIPAGVLGTLVVLRRLAFATHAFATGAFPGVVIAAALGVSAFAGGLAAAIVLAGALALLARRRDLDAPTATGLLLAGALALGSVLVSNVYGSTERVDTLLLGSLFGVEDADLVRAGVVLALVLVAVAVQGRGWVLLAFDPANARTLGVARAPHDLVLLGLLAVVVVAAVDAVGALLASSLLVIPAAAARLLTRRAPAAMALASGLTLVASTGGLLLAYHLNAPAGATVAVVACGLFALAFLGRRLAEPRRARRTLALAGAALLVAVAAGCGSGDDATPVDASTSSVAAAADANPLQVVATTTIVADWTRAVGGAHVEVHQVLQPNVDPHDFEPGADDAKAVAGAAVVLASGAGLDHWAGALVESSGSAAPFVEIAPTDALQAPALHGDDAGEGNVDPHFWHDPTLAARAVDAIAEALAKADPASAAAFRANAAAYRAQLEELDRELKATFAAIPADRRKMVTDHDAFGYLARRYGIELVGAAIPSVSTAAEASAKDTAALIDAIRAQGVRAVFSEASVDPGLVERIADETGAIVYDDLYGDTLGPPGSPGATYLEMMRHNASVLAKGFSG